MIPVIWESFRRDDGIIARGYWDQGLLERIFDRSIWRPPHPAVFEHFDGFADFAGRGDGDGAIVVFPAQHHVDHIYIEMLNDHLSGLEWVILFLTGDEHHLFRWQSVEHPNMRLWVMTPHPDIHTDPEIRAVPDGFKGDTPEILDELFLDTPGRDLRWSFLGQVNSDRRRECVDALKVLDDEDSMLLETRGFTQGLDRREYLQSLMRSRFAPCPAGHAMPSSFRVYEALEAGCIPLPDVFSGHPRVPDSPQFWGDLLGTDFIANVATFTDWNDAESFMDAVDDDGWFGAAAVASAWWQGYKRHLVYRLETDVRAFHPFDWSNLSRVDDHVTVLIPTSPIPSHPSTEIIEETVESIRLQFPGAEIIIGCDGVRPEQEHRAPLYAEYLYHLTRLCEHRWHNVIPIIADGWMHQANLTRMMLGEVNTDAVLFVEHDTPIYGDIPWADLLRVLGPLDVVRLSHESEILPDHRHLMIGQVEEFRGVPLQATVQWSQRPHLASTAYYRQMIADHFPATSRTMIEDKMHGVAQDDPANHRIAIFHPEGDIKRSWHTDGRGEDPKFDMVFD